MSPRRPGLNTGLSRRPDLALLLILAQRGSALFRDSFFRMCRARCSLISRCRGTGWHIPVEGFWYQSCRPPWRTKRHPSRSIRRIRSRRFMQSADCRPVVPFRSPRRSSPGRYRRGFPGVRPSSRPGSYSRETPQDSPTKTGHLANRQSGFQFLRCSCLTFYHLTRHSPIFGFGHSLGCTPALVVRTRTWSRIPDAVTVCDPGRKKSVTIMVTGSGKPHGLHSPINTPLESLCVASARFLRRL